MSWLVFFIVLLLLILGLLLMPIVFFIDTATNEYYVQLRGLVKASIEKHEDELLRIEMKIPFYKFYFYPLRKNRHTKKSETKKKVIGKRDIIKRRKRTYIRKLIGMLRSFKVKSFLIDIDSGNCIYNARLFPLFGFLNFYVGDFRINFEGRNRLVLHMQNRPIYIIKTFINT